MGSPYLDIGTGLAPLLAGWGEIIVARENFEGPHVWHNRRSLPQDAQKCRPARPQRVRARGVPSGYVEGLNDVRTPLEAFISSW
jgi:hypothetical protein